ncbi:hypothetical protein KC906_00340, partial [Candidatus Kaiserbacteria bacterium]|nr:hypothetical protein [Candidatus Kaiserbacteria bacterium]
ESGATFTGASSLVTFTSTSTSQRITSAASSTFTFYDLAFTGGGSWQVLTPIISQTDIHVASGTVSGVANITLNNGSFYGDGLVDMTGGITRLQNTNTLGGANGWSFYNLTLGSGSGAGVTTPGSNATTTVRNILTVSTAHFLDAFGSVWDLQGNGNVFVENGTFLEGTSTVRYSGTTPNVRRTAYHHLVVDTESGGSVTAVAPTTGLQVLGDFTLGVQGTSTLNVTTNDPLFAIAGDVYIGSLGTLIASNSNILNVFGDWDNDGVFVANGGTVEFLQAGGSATVAAGNSSFANVVVQGGALYTFSESATATEDFLIDTSGFTLSSGQTLAVGGTFTNNMDDTDTTWSGTTLSLYGGTAYTINPKSTSDTYNVLVVSSSTHPRLWNSTTTAVTTNGTSSLYSMDHEGNDGALYIFGDLVSDSFTDHWSYTTDFDGVALGGGARPALVYVENGGSITYTGGSLSIQGSTTASTSIAVQTAGTYDFTIGGTTDTIMNYYTVRDTTIDGLVFTGTPDVSDLSYGDFEVAIASGTAMTVGGSVIDVNPAQEYDMVRLATTTAIDAYNVTATGTSASAWRFVNVVGNLGGEAKDVDPAGDPGYITWEDSAAVINITGTVFSDEGSTPMGVTVCDGITNSVALSINGTTFASTTCAIGTGVYTFSNISYGLGNTLTVYIDNETEKAVTVTQDPISSISNFNLYQDRVIIKHESGAPMTIADMGTWDSDDDADVLFDVETAGSDSLTLPADTKLIVWNNKQFDPNGDVIVSGGGAGAAHDGTVELRSGATWSGGDGESYTIGGSLLAGASAVFTPAQSTTTFTTTGAARTIDTNDGGFYNLSFIGSGSWTVSDTELTVGNDLDITAGGVTLPAATTTIGGSFTNAGGSFNANNGLLYFDATTAGNVIAFGGSDAHEVIFAGVGGGWTMNDTNATTTSSFTVTDGAVALPTGILTVTGDFVVTDTVTHSNGTVKLVATGGGNVLTLSANDLGTLIMEAGGGDYSLTDVSAAFLGDVLLNSGTFTANTGTLSIAGSFDATAATFVHNNGTVLFNSDDTGETIDPGVNAFYNLLIAGLGGGWTILDHATTTNNLTISLGSSFTQASSTTLYVGGVFTNTLGGSATNWHGSTLFLDSGTAYTTNLKTTPTEQYNKLVLGANTDLRSWNTSATSTNIDSSSSWYSQDHAGTDGALYIYGDYHISAVTEHWSRATDFDGAVLGSPRTVNVGIASSSVVTVDGGVLNIVGAVGATTTVAKQSVGLYTFVVDSGTFNANYYSFRHLDSAGLQLTGNADITSLDNGDFEQANNSTVLITLASTTLNANASFV